MDPPFGRGLGGPGGWLFLVEPELHLGRNVLVPDLAGWPRDGLKIDDLDPYPTVAPAWLCEVLSPGTEVFDRGTKATAFARAGVAWLWFVDPEARTLEVYRNDAGAWRPEASTWSGETLINAPPIEELSWPLGVLWSVLPIH
jgi:Uma2 family endonuclease